MFGVFNLHKPADVTSRDVVNIVQRLVRPAKIGHAGTLDPMATGVLLVCVGGATRLISMLQQSRKTYVTKFTLGQTSDTDDSTGTVEHVTVESPPGRDAITLALRSFVGEIQQVPPKFSAVKVKGQRAYAKARRGEDVELAAKNVVVYAIEILRYEWPQLSLKIECGSGTYIRSIARDLGELLGCGGLMSALERTQIGPFNVATAIDAETLTHENLSHRLVNPIQIVADLPQYRCDNHDLMQLKAGRQLTVSEDRLHWPNQGPRPPQQPHPIAITSADGHQLLAMAEFANNGQQLQPRLVFVK